MPRIQFKGKNLVANHHLAAAFCEIKPRKDLSLLSKGENVSLHDNLILHGDNLLALKALLPTHAGKINCVYIDPPYNTGNEKWCYNDNVANPMTKEWLGKVVDREDLTRHDKWLCMMTPRLSLLHELLAEDGVIFISIDDNEVHRLRMLMDEIFGEDNFINSFAWINKIEGRQITRAGAAGTYESILAYAKNIEKMMPWSKISVKTATCLMPTAYKNQNHEILRDDVGDYIITHELHNHNSEFNESTRKNLVFVIHYNPKTQKVKFSEIGDNKKYPGFAIIHPRPISGDINKFYAWRWSRDKIQSDLNDLHFEKSDKSFCIYTKRRCFDLTNFKDIITNIGGGNRLLTEIGLNFPNTKPINLVKLLINSSVHKNSIILDSFAGSGTTAHAVLDLNKEDGGNRKFILIECEEYADTTTAERVRRVINGVKTAKDKNLQTGLGGSFSYWELGDPIKLKSILAKNKLPSYEDLARYVFYTATGEEWNQNKMKKTKNYIGESRLYEVYLLYQPNIKALKETALTLNITEELPPSKSGKTRIIFAPVRYVEEDILQSQKIKYCQLPFEIYKMAGGNTKPTKETR